MRKKKARIIRFSDKKEVLLRQNLMFLQFSMFRLIFAHYKKYNKTNKNKSVGSEEN